MGRMKVALGLEMGRTKVWYGVSVGRYETSYKTEKKARDKVRKMVKRYPESQVRLSKVTMVENEKRPFWRFWHIENASLRVEPLTIQK
jgi:hypothetical protein